MMRTEFSRKTRKQAWDRCKGKCEGCGLPFAGRAEYDHILPAALGGEPTLANCRVYCPKCHRQKTNKDISRLRKADRQRDKASGAKRSRNPMPGSRSSRWKKRMDGKVERRET